MNVLFQSKRLLFRQFTGDDAGLIYELNSDPEVIRYVHEKPATPATAVQLIGNVILPQYMLGLGRWAVHLKYTAEFIGWCGLKYLAESDEVDLGFRFKKAFWGRGYATEAASTCIQYGFAHLNIRTIVARAHVDNAASLNVIEKCGMQFLGEEMVDGTPVKTYQLVNPSM
ncbi:MAG TPA: GNAT family N-acetyltransferase [Chitinophagaceae bacterium]